MLLIAGGTGLVARPIVKGLSRIAGPKRLLVEGPAPAELRGDFEIHEAAFTDSAATARALEGVREVFLIPKIDGKLIDKQGALLAAAKRAGVEEVTLVSLIGADCGCCVRLLRWLGTIEKEAVALGFRTTVLRTAPFMQNILLFTRANLSSRIILAPFRDARFPWLNACDLAAAMSRLSEPTPANAVLTLTGPESLGVEDIAQKISKLMGTTYSYVDITMHQARGYLESAGLDALQVLAITEWWDALISGFIQTPVSPDLGALLGRAPTTMDEFLATHCQSLGGPAAAASTQPDPNILASV